MKEISKDFKWNEVRVQYGSRFDPDTCEIYPCYSENRSDKEIINNTSGFEHRVAIEALCRVISELIEIEEKRE